MEILKVKKNRDISVGKIYNTIQQLSFNYNNKLYKEIREIIGKRGYEYDPLYKINLYTTVINYKNKNISFINFNTNSDIEIDKNKYNNIIKKENKNILYGKWNMKNILDNISLFISNNFVTLQYAFIILYLIFKTTKMKYDKREKYKKILSTIRNQIILIKTTEEELIFIKSLNEYQECIYKQICYNMLYNMIETYHIIKIIDMINKIKNKSSFISGTLTLNTNYLNHDDNECIKYPLNHAQLYFIENNTLYHYDPEFNDTNNRIKLLVNKININFISLTNNISIQYYLNDNYCIFHVLRYMLIMVDTNFRDKNKLGQIILTQYPKKKKITKQFIINWIMSLITDYFIE